MRNSTSKRSRSLALLAAGLFVTLGACGDDDEDDAAETDETTAAADDGGDDGITIEGFSFSDATVAAGSTVTVVNADNASHTVTSDDDAWEEVEVGGSGDGELTAPSEPGEYDYHCEIHTTMTGTLVVE